MYLSSKRNTRGSSRHATFQEQWYLASGKSDLQGLTPLVIVGPGFLKKQKHYLIFLYGVVAVLCFILVAKISL